MLQKHHQYEIYVSLKEKIAIPADKYSSVSKNFLSSTKAISNLRSCKETETFSPIVVSP
jgi:hypothetical protein